VRIRAIRSPILQLLQLLTPDSWILDSFSTQSGSTLNRNRRFDGRMRIVPDQLDVFVLKIL